MSDRQPKALRRTDLLKVDGQSGQLHVTRFRVEVVSGPDAGKSADLDGTLFVGSHPDAGLVLTDPTVSRQHLELRATQEGVLFRDLDSSNGTFLGGTRVREGRVERETHLVVGATVLRVEVEDQTVPLEMEEDRFGRALGRSEGMRRVFALLRNAAVTDSTVLLLGETGTGKELLAEGVHRLSGRRARPLVVFDCGAAAPTLVESELFGHAKGAYTGAVGERKGAFLEADGGTLFLDEIGELPLDVQPKLLRALENGTVRRLGEDKPRQTNVRIVAATHRDLEAEVEAGRFRSDLFFRLAVLPVRIPPLRERPEDVEPLARHLVRELGRAEFDLSPGLLEHLVQHPWPGNVRELRNVVERALAGGEFAPSSSGAPAGGDRGAAASPGAPLPFREAKERLVEDFTREYFVDLFRRCEGNVSQVARTAGIGRNHVYRLVEKYGLPVK